MIILKIYPWNNMSTKLNYDKLLNDFENLKF